MSGFRDADVAAAVLDLDGCFVAVNGAFERLFAVTECTLVGQPLSSAVVAADVAADTLAELGAGRADVARRLSRRAGGERQAVVIEERRRLVRDAGGRPHRIVVSFVESVLGRTVGSLADTLAVYETLVSSTADLIGVLDADGTILYVSPSIERILGYQPADVTGRPAIDLVHEDDRDRLAEKIRADLGQPGRAMPVEFRIRHRDGSYRWMESLPANQERGSRPGGLVVFSRDITARRRNEETAALLRRATRDVAQATGIDDALAVLARAAQEVVPFERASFALQEGGAFRVAAAFGALQAAIPIGSVLPAHDPGLERVLKTLQPVAGSPTRAVGPGSRRAIGAGIQAAVLVPVVARGEAVGLLVFSRTGAGDFTEAEIDRLAGFVAETGGIFATMLLLERERRLTEELRAANRLKSDYVGMVAHDLKNPLMVIGGFAEVLRNALAAEATSDPVSLAVDTIGRNVVRMQKLVGDVLDVARLESGEVEWNASPFDVPGLVAQVVEDFRLAHPEREVAVEVATPVALGLGDAARYVQVLDNLLSNADKFAPQETPIDVTVTAWEDRPIVAVHDRGPGIPEGSRQLLFQRFSRLLEGQTAEGSGLGLYICRLLVEGQGGTIRHAPREGGGSSFSFSVPAAR